MIHDQEEAKQLLAELITMRDKLREEVDLLKYRATGRKTYYALSIKSFPPPIREDPIACVRWLCCDMWRLATPGEFDALTPDELKERIEDRYGAKQKAYWNAKIAELRTDIAAVGADARAGRVAAESADSKIRTPRADKGAGHRRQPHISGAWKTAADVAEDFDRAAFQPEPGAQKMGTCDERKVNRWDGEHPDAEHANKWGYHARLRTDPDLKAEYFKVLAAWGEHWKTYKEQFGAWRKGHRLSPRGDFRFTPPKRTDIDPARMGRTSKGDLVIEPKPDPRRT